MNQYIPERIANFKEYHPNMAPMDVLLDANESPFLPDPRVMDAFLEEVKTLEYNRYPDPSAARPIRAFADLYHVEPNQVVAGNGSDELIGLILSGFLSEGDKMLVVSPDFSMYAFYGSLYGVEVIPYSKDTVLFNIDFEALGKTAKESGAKLIIFSNPCNPTGTLYPREALLKFTREADALVILDEAYMEFAREDMSLIGYIDALDNLMVLKTISKIYGAASIRLGFCVANEELIGAIYKFKSPYNVNVLTQVLGSLILENPAVIEERKAYICEQRDTVLPALKALGEQFGFTVYDTHTNFILMDMKGKARELFEALKERKIRIRILDPYLRVTIGEAKDNQVFLDAFREILGQSQSSKL